MTTKALSFSWPKDAGIGALLAAGAVALLWSTRALHQTTDSLTYALAAETSERLFHPHHLLYSPLVRALWLAGNRLGVGWDGVAAGQLHAVFWAAIVIACAYLTVSRLVASRAAGTAAALALLSCQGLLVYATQVEVYVPATGAVAILTAALLWTGRTSLGEISPWAAVPLLALFVFYHQTNVLFVVPLAALMLWKREQRAEQLRRYVMIVGLCGALVLGGYVAAYHVEADEISLQGFVTFCLRYAVLDRPGWGSMEHVGGSGLLRLLESQTWGLVALPEALRRGCAMALGAVLFMALGWNGLRAIRGADDGPVRAFLVSWVVVYAAFFLWWLPGEHEFFVTPLFPLTLLAFLTFDDLAKRLPTARAGAALYAGVAAVALLLLLPRSLQVSVLPAHRSRGPVFEAAALYAPLIPEDCAVFARVPATAALRYHFRVDRSRSFALRPLQVLWYQSPPSFEAPAQPPHACRIVPRSQLLPEQRLAGRNGYTDPVAWEGFLRWIFRLESSPDSPGLRYGPIEARADRAGRIYFQQVGVTGEEAAGLGEFLRMLDREAAALQPTARASFTRWHVRRDSRP